MTAEEVIGLFADKTGAEETVRLLQLSPSHALQVLNYDQTRVIYLLMESGVWKATEAAPVQGDRMHNFTFAPWDQIASVSLTLTREARKALLHGSARRRHYMALAESSLVIHYRHPAWVITGEELTAQKHAEDEAHAGTVEALFAMCSLASSNGVEVTVTSGGDPADSAAPTAVMPIEH